MMSVMHYESLVRDERECIGLKKRLEEENTILKAIKLTEFFVLSFVTLKL